MVPLEGIENQSRKITNTGTSELANFIATPKTTPTFILSFGFNLRAAGNQDDNVLIANGSA